MPRKGMNMDYAKALHALQSARSKDAGKKIDHNTRIFARADHLAVRLHNTDIIKFYPDGAVTLNTGGWKTVTTKDRINEFSGIRVWSDKGTWFAGMNGKSVPFADGMTFRPDGTIEGAGEPDTADVERKQKKAVKAYAAAFVDAVFAGNVPAPSTGDCWHCCMRDAEGKEWGGGTHVESHIEENYYVPSLAVNALKMFGASIAETQTLHALLQNERQHAFSTDRNSFIGKGMQKHIYRYCLRQLGIAS